ncbi:hypothetical protein LX36DRAFT_259527 [Colletotrichum falcatum]|nr:hypothetical protein LX36DRAFT_259527 [Colletotrichum falcatum]
MVNVIGQTVDFPMLTCDHGSRTPPTKIQHPSIGDGRSCPGYNYANPVTVECNYKLLLKLVRLIFCLVGFVHQYKRTSRHGFRKATSNIRQHDGRSPVSHPKAREPATRLHQCHLILQYPPRGCSGRARRGQQATATADAAGEACPIYSSTRTMASEAGTAKEPFGVGHGCAI